MTIDFESTKRAQFDAADPESSAWVNANAGAGKTHVLTLRVLRLLLGGTTPERILCLTYTKAAAAEMSKRVFDTLATWATAEDGKLRAALIEALGREPKDQDIAHARTLFARAIETPGGLKVQTIHAFAERLLQRFPLEAGVTPGFRILDDADAREIMARAIDATLVAATGDKNSPLGKALSLVIRYAADANFDALLAKMMNERTWLEIASQLDHGQSRHDYAAAEAYLRGVFGLAANDDETRLETLRAAVLADAELRAIADVLRTGSNTDCECADLLAQALAQRETKARGGLLAEWFLTGKGERRKSLLGAVPARARPDLVGVAADAQIRFAALTQRLDALRLVNSTAALYRLAGAALNHYTAAKQAAGALDFEDLIARTSGLLSGERFGAAEWVLYKLDGGLDHILVDEAQDTSPAQWRIIEALAAEFFSGSGARDALRTIFAVGDEKQSIYSFQGAAPEKFAEMGQRFGEMASGAKTSMRRVPLNLSFRSVAPVLRAVDNVFADAAATPGLTASGDAIRHAAKRIGQAGLVELWPTEASVKADAADAWSPLEDESATAPANRLAARIADAIDGWLKSGEELSSQGRPIRAGDIIILVRKRQPFATPMVAALKKRGIPVAGADRMTLIDQIAVQDLMAIGDVMALPEDDLALASVLKSPIFDLDDDDLLKIAPKRKGALWKALLERAKTDPRFEPAAETLKRWRSKGDYMPPFEFYSTVLDRDGGRKKMLRRLGPEAADAIDEFLDLALAYDDRAAPSLVGFLADLRAGASEVKRDVDSARDEVRVMTVHGAKGLEAPIVFLPDTCTTTNGDSNAARLLALPGVERPGALPDPILWPVKGTSGLAQVQRAAAAKKARDTEERNRLLYVAMTRAMDRLYITGFDGKSGRPGDCWYEHAVSRLKPLMTAVDEGEGRTIWRLDCAQSAEIEKPKAAAHSAIAPIAPPDWALRRAPHEPQLSVPLAPSRLEPYAPDDEGEAVISRPAHDPAISNDAPSPLHASDERRFLRGTVTHALLQHLPEIARENRRTAAEAFVDKRGGELTAKARRSIVDETLAILESSDFASLFGPRSRAEVAISASLPQPSGARPALRLSGQIDRLVVSDTEVVIIDYKTNRPPPRDVAQVADAYLFQLAAYVLALREIYPGKVVRAALLWTDGPRLMPIPANVIDDAIRRLWTLDLASLDAP